MRKICRQVEKEAEREKETERKRQSERDREKETERKRGEKLTFNTMQYDTASERDREMDVSDFFNQKDRETVKKRNRETKKQRNLPYRPLLTQS